MTNKKKVTTAYLDIAIPENVENMQLPSPELLTFYKIPSKNLLKTSKKSDVVIFSLSLIHISEPTRPY